MSKQWQYHSHYKGVVIEYRPGMQRRGWCSIYHNWYANGEIGHPFVHHSLENAHRHIDKLHKDLGDRIAVTMDEYREWASDVV